MVVAENADAGRVNRRVLYARSIRVMIPERNDQVAAHKLNGPDGERQPAGKHTQVTVFLSRAGNPGFPSGGGALGGTSRRIVHLTRQRLCAELSRTQLTTRRVTALPVVLTGAHGLVPPRCKFR